jgi:DNA-directed RNA polymerase subunit M/transcription elongation factor TFIIS
MPTLGSLEAAAMIAEGAPHEAALHHLTSAGIAAEHARPEIDRLLAAHQQRLASMRPCDRCGTRVAPSDTYFDRLGNQVCGRCNAEDEIGASEQRAEDARLEAAGVPLHEIQKDHAVLWCPRCQDHSAVLQQATHVRAHGLSTATRVYRCTRCGQPV